MELNKIYNMDCYDGIARLDDESVDLVITSPPYNVDLGKNKYNKNPYDLYVDNKEHGEYIAWITSIFYEVYMKLKNGGRVVINIGDGKNGAVPTNSDFIQLMVRLGYLPMTHIIWNKNSTGNRTAWGSFMSPSCPSFPTPFEHILVFAKGSTKLQYAGETDITREEFIAWSYAMWVFPPELRQKKMGHPAMFPEELPLRCIKMLSYKGATVLDPFAGLGTTCKVAKELGRNYIGFEISEEYCEIANDRINIC
jgi:DNA modification methylase